MTIFRPALPLASVVLLCMSACHRDASQKTAGQPSHPLLKRASQPYSDWIREWSGSLPVTARLKMRPRPERVDFTAATFRSYVVRLEIENRTPHAMEQTDAAFLFESAKVPLPGEKPASVLAVAAGSFIETPVADYSGAIELRGDERLEGKHFLSYGLSNGEVRLRNGQILRRIDSPRSLNYITYERAAEAVFSPAPPKATARINAEPMLRVTVKSDKLAQVWYVTPVLTFRSPSGEQAQFRYLLGFSPPGANPLANWVLSEKRLVSLDTAGLLPIVTDKAAPTWMRAFAAFWAPEYAKDAAGPAFLQVLAEAPAEHPSLRAAAFSGVEDLAYSAALPQVTAALTSTTELPAVRRSAIGAAGAIGGRDLVPELLKTAGGKNRDSAVLAIIALGKLRDRSGIPPLLEMLRDARYEKLYDDIGRALGRDKDPSLAAQIAQLAAGPAVKGRTAAIQALSGRKEPETVTLLVKLCTAEAAKVRAEACTALARAPEEQSAAAIKAALDGADAKLAEETARALASQEGPISDRLLQDGLNSRHASVFGVAATALGRRKKPVRDDLNKALARKETKFRVEAAGVLGYLRDSAACSSLLPLLKDAQSEVRAAAAEAAGNLACRDAVDALAGLLDLSQPYEVRRAATLALGQVPDSRVVAPLVSVVKHGADDLQPLGAAGLGGYDDPAAVGALAEALRASDVFLDRAAAYALAKTASDRAADALLGALKSGDAGTRQSAASGLERLSGQDYWLDAAAWTQWRAQKTVASR